MNRGKDRRRHTLTHLPRIPCLVDTKIISRMQSTRARTRACTSLSITHIAEKRKQTLDYLIFAKKMRKRCITKSHTSGRDMECRGPTDPLSLLPKKSARCLPSQKKNIKLEREKKTARRYEKKRRERGNEKSTHESTALYPVVI